MAIRFTDKPSDEPRPKPTPQSRDGDAQAQGAARFATPIEAVGAVNPDPGGTLPFSDLPQTEKAAKRKRPPKGTAER